MIKGEDTSTDKYNLEWFSSRAFNSLQKIEDCVFDYSDSGLNYLPTDAAEYEKNQEPGRIYERLVTAPEKAYLPTIAKDLVEFLPKKFEYIDLGPGTAHKEQYFFDEMFKADKEFVYRPVDINSSFLKTAAKYAEDQKPES